MTRTRLSSLLEWALAALCAFGLMLLGSWMLRQFRQVPGPIVPVAAKSIGDATTTALPPAAVPPRAVSVPLVLLSSGLELRVGEPESTAAGKLRPVWRVGQDVLERVAGGTRITRAYNDGLRRFLIVLDPPVGTSERRVSSIYVG